MKLSGSDRQYTATKKLVNPVCVRYEVVEWDAGQRSRKFTAELSHTQATREHVEQLIARWCELNPDKLPSDGGTFQPDLDKVERITDRR